MLTSPKPKKRQRVALPIRYFLSDDVFYIVSQYLRDPTNLRNVSTTHRALVDLANEDLKRVVQNKIEYDPNRICSIGRYNEMRGAQKHGRHIGSYYYTKGECVSHTCYGIDITHYRYGVKHGAWERYNSDSSEHHQEDMNNMCRNEYMEHLILRSMARYVCGELDGWGIECCEGGNVIYTLYKHDIVIKMLPFNYFERKPWRSMILYSGNTSVTIDGFATFPWHTQITYSDDDGNHLYIDELGTNVTNGKATDKGDGTVAFTHSRFTMDCKTDIFSKISDKPMPIHHRYWPINKINHMLKLIKEQ